jgi:hypothetical protein
MLKQMQMATDLHLYTVLMNQQEWEKKIPEFSKSLEKVCVFLSSFLLAFSVVCSCWSLLFVALQIPDFYLEIDWKVSLLRFFFACSLFRFSLSLFLSHLCFSSSSVPFFFSFRSVLVLLFFVSGGDVDSPGCSLRSL